MTENVSLYSHQSFSRQNSTRNRKEENKSLAAGNDAGNSEYEKSSEKKFGLKKQIGLPEAVSVIVGVIIGSGIFMTPGGILQDVGSVGMSLVIWAMCGLFSMLCTLSYMELGLIISESGAEYAYCIRAYGDVVGFICAWGTAIVAKPASFLLMLYTFSEYLLSFFYPGCETPQSTMKLVTCCAIIVITSVNLVSVRLGAKITESLMYAKVVVMLIIVATGIVQLANGKTDNFVDPFKGTSTNILAYASAFYGGMWSFDGWNQLNFIVEELKDPIRDFPRAVWMSIPMVTIIYLFMNVAYFTVMTPAEIVANDAVAVTFAYRTLGASWAWLIPLGVVLSTFGATNGTVFTSARLTWVAARRSHLPKFLSYVDVVRTSPSMALLFNSSIALLMTIPDSSKFGTILDLFSFTQWMFYGLSCSAVLVFRWKEPFKSKHRPYRVPIIIPIIACLGSLFLVIAPIIDDPNLSWLYITIFLFSGLVFYIPFNVYGKKPRNFMRWLTLKIQLGMQVAPSEMMPDE